MQKRWEEEMSLAVEARLGTREFRCSGMGRPIPPACLHSLAGYRERIILVENTGPLSSTTETHAAVGNRTGLRNEPRMKKKKNILRIGYV